MKKLLTILLLAASASGFSQLKGLNKANRIYADSTSFVSAVVVNNITTVAYCGVSSNIKGTFVSHDSTGFTIDNVNVLHTGVGSLYWLKVGNASGGAGTVTSFSAGSLSPLFTTSVATATSTPALTFSLSNASAYTVFGRAASTGVPSFLSSLDSNWIPTLHSEAYYNTKYSTGSGGGGGTGLTPTAVKTANYTASVGDYVPCNTTSGGFTVTLPLTPANGSVVAVQLVTYVAGNSLTVSASGSEVFNKSGGPTTFTMTYVNQVYWFQFNSGIWYYLNNAPAGSILGTTNQVNVSTSGSTVTLSTPQSIATSSNVSFNGLTVTGGLGATVINAASFPVILYQISGSGKGYTGATSSSGTFFSNAVAGDMLLRAENGGNVQIGVDPGSAANSEITVNQNGTILNKSFALPYAAKITTYAATASDHTIDCTTGTFTVTLPTAVGIQGRQYTIVNTGSGTITIATTSSQTFKNINGTPTSLTLNPVGATAIVSYTVESTNVGWIVTAKVKDE